MRREGDSGFTLIELLVAMSVMGIMSGLAMTSFSSWSQSSEHRGARDEVVSTLRNAAERALSEGRTYCVEYTGTAWTTYRTACSPTGTVVSGPIRPDSTKENFAATLAAPSGSEDSCPTAGTCAYFYPRGNASAGNVVVKRSGQSDYTVTIVGLTSRVYVS